MKYSKNERRKTQNFLHDIEAGLQVSCHLSVKIKACSLECVLIGAQTEMFVTAELKYKKILI